LGICRALCLTDAANEKQSGTALIAKHQTGNGFRQHRLIGDSLCDQILA
jgi:hypothetical protein